MGSCLCLARCVSECCDGVGGGPFVSAHPLGHSLRPPWLGAAPAPALQAHTDSLNTLVALHQLYQYTQKYYDEVGGPV